MGRRIRDSRCGQWEALMDEIEPRPCHAATRRSSVQPVAPAQLHEVKHATQRSGVSRDAEVAVMPAQLRAQACVLLSNRGVAVIAQPDSHRSQRAAEALATA